MPARARGRTAPLLALFLAFGLSAGCADDEPRLARLAAGAKVLAFGDSLTFGTGAEPGESYPAVLAALTGLDVVRSGVPGETSGEGLRRLPGALEVEAPRLVILCHGGNDFLKRRGKSGAESNLREMVSLVRAAGADVVLLGVPDFGIPGLLSAADLYERVADELDVPLDDETLPELIGDNDFKSDPVHPNAAGYAKLAAAVKALLVREGALER